MKNKSLKGITFLKALRFGVKQFTFLNWSVLCKSAKRKSMFSKTSLSVFISKGKEVDEKLNCRNLCVDRRILLLNCCNIKKNSADLYGLMGH